MITRLGLTLVLGAVLPVALACQSRTAAVEGELRVILHAAEGSGRPAHVEVTGLSASETSALRARTLDDAAWSVLFNVSVANQTDASLPAIAGRYAIKADSVTFTPLYPFDRGRGYRVRVDFSKLRSGSTITSIVTLPAGDAGPAAEVAAVHPDGAVVPENLLRMYVEFSAPMGSRQAGEFVRLVDRTTGSDVTVDEAFLPVEADFWSPDHRRYTLFLDPGRVKRGILPNRQRGRPLRAGRAYALVIAADWPDERGRPLKTAFRHEFTAGPAVASGIDAASWCITAPAAGSRDPVVVAFDRPLDRAVALRALGVEHDGRPVAGAGAIAQGDTRWTFTPGTAWQAGDYRLTAQPYLEDPQGNQIGRAFEVLVDTPREPNRSPYRMASVVGRSQS